MRTAKCLVFGGHKITCTACGEEIYCYNSCGDANCPQCQNIKKALWVDKISEHLLGIKHFHIIFTLPHELNDLIYYNQKKLYGLLFKVGWQTINQMCGGGKTGMVASLHSWGSNLSYHPHLHCIVPAGSYKDGGWEYPNGSTPRFYCDAKELRETYKKLFLKELREVIEFECLYWQSESIDEDEALFKNVEKAINKATRKKWTVRIENPVLGTDQIIEYLGRYVRRVAITNSRIDQVTDKKVVINYKQYHLQKKGKAPPIGKMEFDGPVFIQRFSQHIMPPGFHKVRYYGFYSFGSKKLKAEICKQLTHQAPVPYQVPNKKTLLKKLLGHDPDLCTTCGSYACFVTEGLPENSSMHYKLTESKYRSPIRAGPNKADLVKFGGRNVLAS